MQATVSAWNDIERTGRVVLDDGQELPIAAGAVAEADLVRLRPGQRVSIDRGQDGGQVVRVRLLG